MLLTKIGISPLPPLMILPFPMAVGSSPARSELESSTYSNPSTTNPPFRPSYHQMSQNSPHRSRIPKRSADSSSILLHIFVACKRPSLSAQGSASTIQTATSFTPPSLPTPLRPMDILWDQLQTHEAGPPRARSHLPLHCLVPTIIGVFCAWTRFLESG